MNMLFKKTISILPSAVVAMSLAGCSEAFMDEINKDLDHATDVESKFIVPQLELLTAQNVVGGDFNTYFGAYIEHWTGTHNQLYNIENRMGQERLSTTFNNSWANVYEAIRDAKIAVAKCSEGGQESGNVLVRSIAKIMLAYNAAVATDVFGDTPFSQTGNVDSYMNPKIDTQEDIYKEIMTLLDDAIADLGGASNTTGSYDFIYGGKADLWKKFAYGLKARYTMRLINRSADKATDYANIISYVDNSFANASEQASLNVYDGTNQNPVFDFQWSRDGISSSKSLYNKLVDRKDPRAEMAYVHSGAWAYLDSATVKDYLPDNGDCEQSQYEYAYDYSSMAELASVHLLSYHEILFLKAEAQARLGMTTPAEATLKEAIKASMKNFEENLDAALNSPTLLEYGGLEEPASTTIADAEIESYFSVNVKPLYDADPVKEIMLQKYIAFWGANGESVECYNDVRRMKAMGEDVYSLANPKPEKFPLRAGYGTDDTSSNPNIKEAYGDGMYVYTENVWWAGGTR